MDEREILENGENMPENTVQPEPSEQTFSAEELAAQERMEQIFKSVGENRPKKEETPRDLPTEAPEKEEKEEAEENASAEIELMTVARPSKAEKRAIAKREKLAAKKQKRKKAKKVCLVLLVVVIVMVGGALYTEYAPNNQTGEVIVTVPQSASTAQIAKELKKDGLIESEMFFRVMSKLRGIDGKYNYGKFKLDKSASYEEIFKTLTQVSQSEEAVKVVIPEGYEIYKIADLLEEKGLIDKKKFYDLINYGEFDYDFVKDVPQRDNRLEGYLFPNTYMFMPNDEYGIIDEMLSQFDEVYGKYSARAEELGMTMDEVITLASIIEREALGDEDRKLVSSVFHNRINSDEYPYLQSCATVQYVLKERKANLSIADTKIDSPYNTYINPGLPIGPIASPGEKAIEAALYPEESDYFFFVYRNGKHYFAKTNREHEQNKNR